MGETSAGLPRAVPGSLLRVVMVGKGERSCIRPCSGSNHGGKLEWWDRKKEKEIVMRQKESDGSGRQKDGQKYRYW